MTPEQSAALSKPFGPEMIRTKRGQGNREMQYVSHGGITKRLNDAAPDWSATMVERYIQEQGGALHCLGGVMRLTIGGVTREEAGGPARLGTLADDLKNTYSDCLKRCAMRFGVALDLWESAEEADEDAHPDQHEEREPEPRAFEQRYDPKPKRKSDAELLAIAGDGKAMLPRREHAAKAYLARATDPFAAEERAAAVRRIEDFDGRDVDAWRDAALGALREKHPAAYAG